MEPYGAGMHPQQQWTTRPPMPAKKRGPGAGVVLGLAGLAMVLVVAAIVVIAVAGRAKYPITPVAESTPTPTGMVPSRKPSTSKQVAKVDDAGQWACDDFAGGYRSAQTRQARVELANKVNEWAPRSKSGRIADMGVLLGRGADGSVEAWQIGADAFARACFDAGWGKR